MGAPAAVLALGFVAAALGVGPGRATAQGLPADTLRLGLADAIARATEQAPGVREAELGARAADSRVTEARSALLPQVTAVAREGRRTLNTASFGLSFPTAPGEEPPFDPNGEVVGPVRTVDVRGTVSQALFDWSAVERVKGARSALAAARAATVTVRERAAVAAGRAYVQAIRAEGRLEAARSDVDLARELERVARETLEAGVGVRLDVTRAEAQVAAMEARLIAVRNDADHARLLLLRTLDLPLDRPIVLADTGLAGPVPVAADAESSVRQALERRPDLAALERRIDAGEGQARAIRAERLPRLSLVADDGWTGPRYDALLNTYDVGIQLSVPLFDGLGREGRLAERRAEVERLEAERHDLREEVAMEVRSALLDLGSSVEQVEAARARLALAEQEYEQARDRFRAGVAGSGDVTTSALRLSEARTAYVDARAGYQGARVALAAAEGVAAELR